MSVWDDMRALLPDNTTGDISAQDMRDIITYLEGEDAENIKGAEAVKIFLSEASTTDLADTITAITDATTTKRYYIELGPGVHTTKAVTMKSYVFVRGVAESAVVINPTATNITQFTMADSSGLSNVIIDGVTLGTAVSWTGSGFCYLYDVSIQDCQTGVNVNAAGANLVWRIGGFSGTITDGFECYAGNVTLNGIAVAGPSTITKVIEFAGPNVIATMSNFASFSPNVATAIQVSDNCQAIINTPSIVNASAVALQVDTTARCIVKGGGLFDNFIGVYVPVDATVVDLEMTGTTVLNNTTDFNLASTTAKVRLNSITSDLFNSTASPADLIGAVVDETEGDEGVQIFGELKVGRPFQGAESVLGEGDSYAGVGKMYCYTWDGSSWADKTSEASSPSGSTVQFPNGNVNSALYFASRVPQNGSFRKHGGFKMSVTDNVDALGDLLVTGSITPDSTGVYDYWKNINGNPAYQHRTNSYWICFTAGKWAIYSSEPDSGTDRDTAEHESETLEGDYAPVNGTGTATVAKPSSSEQFVIEYWDGAAWQEVNFMMTDSTNSYISHGKEIFRHSGSFQTRFDALLDSDLNWEISDPMSLGTNYYWTRIRITSALSSSPVIEQFKLHTNRTEINADGYLEFFGKARPFNRLPWDQALIQGIGSTVGDQDLYVSDNLLRGTTENALTNGDQIGLNAFLPNQVDTSTPIRLAWSVFSTAAQASLTWTIRWGYTRDGMNVYGSTTAAPTTGPNEMSTTTTGAMASANTQYTYDVDLDISDMLPSQEGAFGDTLWITIELTSGQAAAAVNVINMQPLYCAYVIGGHI